MQRETHIEVGEESSTRVCRGRQKLLDSLQERLDECFSASVLQGLYSC